jgi:hypothetical protein
MQNAPYSSSPIYQKSLALRDLSNAIATYFSKESSFFKLKSSAGLREHIANSIFTDSSLISKQIEQAETSNSYEVRMNSATFINVITRNIMYYCNGLEQDGVKEKEYVNLLRRELKSFRSSFKQWRKSIQ